MLVGTEFINLQKKNLTDNYLYFFSKYWPHIKQFYNRLYLFTRTQLSKP